MTTPTTDVEDAPSIEGADLDRPFRLSAHWPWLVAGAVGLVAAGRMFAWIRAGVHVQYADYWPIIEQTFDSNGSLSLDGLTRFHHQHLLTGTQLTYAANIFAFGGSNISLGFWVLLLAVAQIIILSWWLWGQRDVPVPVAAGLAATASALLLSPHGAWNFLQAMSGTAWLTANLATILAIHLAVRGRIGWSLVMALLAASTYGTGIVAFPVIVVAVLALDRRARTLLLVGTASTGALIAYALLRSSTGVTGLPPPGPSDQVVNTATVIGGVVAPTPAAAAVVGLVAMLALIVLGAVACFRGERTPVAWTCLGLYGLVNAGLIGHSRHGWSSGRENLLAGRYSSISALALIAVGGLIVSSYPWHRGPRLGSAAGSPPARLLSGRAPVIVSTVAAVGLFLVASILPFRGTAEVEAVQQRHARMRHLAIAQRLKISAGKQWFPITVQPDIDDLLERLGHHPFDGRLSDGCDLLGEPSPPPDSVLADSEIVDQADTDLAGGSRLQGRVDLPAEAIDCVVVADGTGSVVGIGLVEVHFGERTMVTAYAPHGHSQLVVLVRTDGRTWHEIPVLGAHGG